MSSAFAEFHGELRSVARQVLSRTLRQATGSVPAWSELAASGWLGLEVPSSLGGTGATFAEVAVVLQELGRAAATSAYVGSAVLGTEALLHAAPAPERDRLLGEVAVGGTKVALALSAGDEDPAEDSFALRMAAGGPRLTGHASDVVDAPDADRLLVLAGSGSSLVLAAVDPAAPGVTLEPRPVVDSTRRLGSVTLAEVPVGDDSVWPVTEPAGRAVRVLRDRGATAIACDSLGIAEAMLEATVSYASVREQFGRPIGSFQAVQHACADMFVQLSLSRELLAEAIAACAGEDTGDGVPVSMAKAYVTTAALGVTGKAMQLHGGIGYTWDSGVHTFLKRAALNRSLFGSPVWHRRRLGRRYLAGVGAGPGE